MRRMCFVVLRTARRHRPGRKLTVDRFALRGQAKATVALQHSMHTSLGFKQSAQIGRVPPQHMHTIWRSACSSGRLLASSLQPALRDTQRTMGTTICAQAAAAVSLKSLEDLKFTSSYTSELPGDPETANSLRQVKGALWSSVSPTANDSKSYLVSYSSEMAEELGLDAADIETEEFVNIFAGNAPLPGSPSHPYAMRYGGHQFGTWAGQLGDGRVVNLGETQGKSGKQWGLQLKGAGKTPYSRMADGRAVMRSSVREFICSEAMHHLGVPTSRALCIVGTGAGVVRDEFYDGNLEWEQGAVVCRMAPSWVRFGSLQLPASQEEPDLARQVADHVIKHHFSHLQGDPDRYLKLLEEVMTRTSKLAAKWQAVGFTHGVLNTDNMSILGDTIDYGPFGFLERFDPNYTPNVTDFQARRYAFRNQPNVCGWNLGALGTSMVMAGLVAKGAAEDVLSKYSSQLQKQYEGHMAQKMGLQKYDKDLAVGLMSMMYEDETDFTNTFRSLASIQSEDTSDSLPRPLQEAVGEELTGERQQAWQDWLQQYKAVLRGEGQSDELRIQLQNSANPCYIPRNHLLQVCIDQAEKGDFTEIERIMQLLRTPYTQREGAEAYTEVAPKGVRMGIECLSCSS